MNSELSSNEMNSVHCQSNTFQEAIASDQEIKKKNGIHLLQLLQLCIDRSKYLFLQ